ncbi:hypothetical protein GCM10009815_23500 [Nocardioides marmoribigeumensis]
MVAAVALGGLAGCSSDSSKASGTPSKTPASATSSSSGSPSASPSATGAPTPEKPTPPVFAPGEKGQKAFAEYVVTSWGYALSTNDATAVTGLSPSKKEQCRGCQDLAAELKRRAKDGWHVDFPGAQVRRTTLKRSDDRILATTVADIPASQSYFDDGTFRNDNEAHKGAKFLIDLRIDGRAKKRHFVLLAFSLR